MLGLLFADKNFLHFVQLKVLQDGENIVVVYRVMKERRLVMFVATFRGLFATIILPTCYAGK